ncbi:hemagglutinin repeat-containing protein [Vibrio sp. SCSIO 43137]|uniref:hemagglutinin repeat-containing protein n=1 Tax=Vibrio sp. SCSIO 43137 TaxID=3021011 RepID=UPI002307BFE7|nr:hemagglutinin repeat-containing protein [Vibrio sp. SCSIO 43137]WCE32070.1 hemagglutinin repeat-containing protein [Vibrio sp. SCSIO 43137]
MKADGEATLTADGDILLTAQQYREYARKETIKKGFGGLSGRQKGSVKDATLLDSGYLITSGNTTLNSGKDIGIVASEVVSDGEVNLTAVDDVLINAGEVLKLSQQWDKKTRFLSGGNLFEMESKREGEQSSTAQASAVRSQGNLTVDAGSVSVVGSELDAQGSINLSADTGSVDIAAAKESRQSYYDHEKLTIGLGDTSKLVSVKDGKLKITLGKATYDKVDEKTQTGTHKGSQLNATENIAVNAESDISVTGSALAADTDGNNSGDITLTAKDNIRITEAKNTESTQRKEVHGKAEASFVVQHQGVEVAKAIKALEESTQRLKQAKEDYSRYKKQVDSLEHTLATLEQQYRDKEPGVNFEDVEELRDLVSDVKGDESWYQAGIVLATEDVVSKTTLAYQQGRALSESTSSFAMGFNAGLELDLSASKSENQSQSTHSLASSLTGENITIDAGNNKGDKVDVQGSQLKANDRVSIDAGEVNLLASTDTSNSQGSNESVNGTISMTLFGATGGANVNLGYSKGRNNSNTTTHTNSTVTGNSIDIRSDNDTNIKGANVAATDVLTMNVGGDLNIESVSDRENSSSKSMGVNGGISLSAADSDASVKTYEGVTHSYTGEGAGDVTGVNAGTHTSSDRKRSKQTVLTSVTSGNTADITVADNTDIKGALVATVDGEGKDQGNLNLATETLTYANLTNTDYNQSRNFAVNSGVSINSKGEGEASGQATAAQPKNDTAKDQSLIDSTYTSSSLKYKNTSGYSKSKTLATVGKGNLTIGDTDKSDDLTALNRDTEHTEKDLFTVDRKQGDIDVTVDHRLLIEDGRKAIAEDVERTKRLGQAVGDVATKESITITDTLDHIGDVQKDLDVQKNLALSDGGKSVDILENKENYSVKEYDQALDQYAKAYASVYGVTIESAKAVATEKFRGMTYSNSADGNATNSRVSIDYNNNGGATDVAETMGHEAAHVRIDQGQTRYREGALAEEYADTFGEYSSDGMEFSAGSYTNVQLNVPKADSGKLIGNTQLVNNTTKMYQDINRDAQGDGVVNYRQLDTPEIQAIRKHAPQMAKELGISTEEAEKRMAEELVTRVDSDWQEYYKSKGRKADGEALNHLSEALSSLGANYVQPDLIPDPEAIYTPDGVKADLVNYKDNYEHRYNDATLYGEGLVTGDKEQQDFYINNLGEHKSDLGETASGTVAGVAKPILDVVDVLEWGIKNPEEGIKLPSYGYQEILNNPEEVVEGIYEGYVDSQVNSVLSSLQGDNYNAAKSGTAGTVQLGLDVGVGTVLVKGTKGVSLPDGGRLPDKLNSVDGKHDKKGTSTIYVDSHGLAIEAQEGSVFRANAVTPEIDKSISENGFSTGKSRGVTQEVGAALPESSPLEDRVVQYVEGSPFPRDTDFVGVKEIPHDALNTAIRTGRQTLKEDNAVIRIDELNINDMNPINVDKIYSETLNRQPRSPIDVAGESVVEGDIPADKIVNTTRLSKEEVDKIKKNRKKKGQ